MPAGKQHKRSAMEEVFLSQWILRYPHLPPVEQFSLPAWIAWARLHKRRGRPMTADFAWPDARVALELEGGTWSRRRSGHSSGKGIRRDIIKGNLAAADGWLLFRLEWHMLHREETEWFELLAQAILSRTPASDA